jgi:hypothetical protein
MPCFFINVFSAGVALSAFPAEMSNQMSRRKIRTDDFEI